METTPIGQQSGLQRFLRLKAVEEVTGLKRSSIYQKMKQGEFPPCVQISAGAVAWREVDIANWQAGKEPKQAGAR